MDSFELNKIIGALLATVFVVFSVSIVSDAIFYSPAPETEGYAIAAIEPEPAGGAEEAPGPEPIAPLMASADPAAGEAAFRRCAACHTVEEGGANRIGPNLWDVMGSPVATHEGFSYSAAMRDYSQGGAVTWEYDNMSAFLLSPGGEVPGTAMNFPGLRDATERAHMIAYLRSLSASPIPLPDPAEAAPEDADAAPGEAEAAPEEGEAAPAGEEADTAPAAAQEDEAEDAAGSPEPAPAPAGAAVGDPETAVPEDDALEVPFEDDADVPAAPAEESGEAPAGEGPGPTEASPTPPADGPVTQPEQ